MDVKIVFEKIQDGKYLAKVENTEILNYVTQIVNEISLGEMNEYLDVNNEGLIESMLARLISSYFFKDKTVKYNENGFSIIIVEIGTIKLRLSVGKLNGENDKLFRVTGVMSSN